MTTEQIYAQYGQKAVLRKIRLLMSIYIKMWCLLMKLLILTWRLGTDWSFVFKTSQLAMNSSIPSCRNEIMDKMALPLIWTFWVLQYLYSSITILATCWMSKGFSSLYVNVSELNISNSNRSRSYTGQSFHSSAHFWKWIEKSSLQKECINLLKKLIHRLHICHCSIRGSEIVNGNGNTFQIW
jgi:hypothetical protein